MVANLSLVPVWTEPEARCQQCGDSSDWHRTDDGQCTHEIYDDSLDAWMRCGCSGWRG